MRRSGKTSVVIITTALLFVQCQEDVAIDFSNFQPKLVVNAQLNSDASFAINVAESTSPISSDPGSIPGDLELSLSNMTLGLEISLYRENDVFIAPQVYPRPGHVYRITASAPGFEKVMAETTIPRHNTLRSVEIENATVTPSQTTEGKNNVSYDVELMMDSDHGQYLHITFWQLTTLNVGTIESPDFEEFVYVISPEFPEEDGFRRHHEQGILIDRETLPDPGLLSFSFRDYTVNDFEELGDVLIGVRTTSPEYYKYFNSLSRQLISRQDPFAEPIPTYNNIDGGLGNFSSFDYELYRAKLLQ